MFTKDPNTKIPQNKKDEIDDNQPQTCSYQCTLEDIEIDENTVSKILQETKPNKSKGPDGIYPRVIAECSKALVYPLTKIFKKSMSTSRIPEEWKKSNVTLLFKSGDKTLPENYRPISISSTCSNIIQKIVRNSLQAHMEKKSFYTISIWILKREIMHPKTFGVK